MCDVDSDPVELDVGVLGVVTDIHANPYALAEVLSHGSRSGVERWLVLGDVVAMGPEPARVLDQLAALDVVASVAGNTERYVLHDERPAPTLEDVAADPRLLRRLVEVAGSFAWTKGFLEGCGSLEILRSFEPQARLRFPDGTDVLAVHASLVADDGRGIAPDVDSEEMAALFPEPGATLVFGGHTHLAADLSFGGTRFVNPGSVSNHDEAHLGASYSIVHLGGSDHTVEHHQVAYDKELVIDSINASGIPGSGFLLRRYFGSQSASRGVTPTNSATPAPAVNPRPPDNAHRRESCTYLR